jgi:hypothetical protein
VWPFSRASTAALTSTSALLPGLSSMACTNAFYIQKTCIRHGTDVCFSLTADVLAAETVRVAYGEQRGQLVKAPELSGRGKLIESQEERSLVLCRKRRVAGLLCTKPRTYHLVASIWARGACVFLSGSTDFADNLSIFTGSTKSSLSPYHGGCVVVGLVGSGFTEQ